MNSIEFDFMLDDRFHNENKKQLNVFFRIFVKISIKLNTNHRPISALCFDPGLILENRVNIG